MRMLQRTADRAGLSLFHQPGRKSDNRPAVTALGLRQFMLPVFGPFLLFQIVLLVAKQLLLQLLLSVKPCRLPFFQFLHGLAEIIICQKKIPFFIDTAAFLNKSDFPPDCLFFFLFLPFQRIKLFFHSVYLLVFCADFSRMLSSFQPLFLLCHIPGLALKRLKPCFCFPQLLKCLLIRFGLLDSFFKLHHFLIQLFQTPGRFFFFPAAVLFQRFQPVHKLFIGMGFP